MGWLSISLLFCRHVAYPEEVSEEINNFNERQKRNTHSEIRGMLSITNNFEVLRRRYIANIKEQNRLRASRQSSDRTQIQENQNFLDSIGWLGSVRKQDWLNLSLHVLPIIAVYAGDRRSTNDSSERYCI